MNSESDGEAITPVVQPTLTEGGCASGETKTSEGEGKSEVKNNGDVHNQVNTGYVKYQYNYSSSKGAAPETIPDELPELPPGLHAFQDPRHADMLSKIENESILLLSSYQESAAYAAAHSLVKDNLFTGLARRALFPTRGRDRERSDLDLLALVDDEFLDEPQILLIDIGSWCTLFDSVLKMDWGILASLCKQLKAHRSYLVLAVDEVLLNDKAAARAKSSLPYYAVSHLRYLFARNLADRAEELEKRLLSAFELGASPLELHEIYQRVAALLAEGVPAFEKFLRELEQASSLPLAVRKERFQPVQPQEVFREESEVHKAAAFVATYFPELGQRDFDRLVLLLLSDETTTAERSKQVISKDGSVFTVREEVTELWSDRWLRNADCVFRDCYLQAVTSGDGTRVVDFGEPYLRRELRGHLERHFPWYVRRRCKTLQDSGVLFALDLSRTAVEGLVRLFVERALVDPSGFDSVWLLDVVHSLRIQIKAEPPPSSSPQERLVWLLKQIEAATVLQVHFHGRLALLIREMLDREALRPTVREFFDILITVKQHGALLDLILYLARSLRFAPHFDPLYWMCRLLDQGSPEVRDRTQTQLIALARKSGPRIYEFLAVIRSWLPEGGRPVQRFSLSNRLALEFPFNLCLKIAHSLPTEKYGAWPSSHPLFYALPGDPMAALEEIARLVDWLFDSRGAALESADPTETMRTAEVVRIGHIADLVEHWAWVLEGGPEQRSAEGCALFRLILEEIHRRASVTDRSWLQRSWQRRQEDYLRQAANASGPGRAFLISKRTKLNQLRLHFGELARPREPIGGIS